MVVRKTFVEWWDNQTEAFRQRNDINACMKAFEAATLHDARYWFKAGKLDTLAKIKILVKGMINNGEA